MERLTTMRDGRPVLAKGYEERFSAASLFFMLLNRVAAYEDAMPIERAQELGSGREGWAAGGASVQGGGYGLVYQQNTVAGYLNDGFRWKVRMTKTIPSWVGNKTEHKYAAFNAFGKTVFLTREEAEAALKKREAGNEAD